MFGRFDNDEPQPVRLLPGARRRQFARFEPTQVNASGNERRAGRVVERGQGVGWIGCAVECAEVIGIETQRFVGHDGSTSCVGVKQAGRAVAGAPRRI